MGLTRFHNVNFWGESLLSDQLEANLYLYFNWGCLGIGGFTNVVVPTSGVYGGNAHQLRLSEDMNYEEGQVWEGFRRDWVWETGIDYQYQPIHVSGVYVNGDFVPVSSTGIYAHKIDYPNGRVIFNAAIPANSTVTCEYSYRACHWTTADSPWWREVQQNSLRVDDPQFMAYGSGAWSTLSQNRIQLPAVIIEATPNSQRYGTQLGGGQTVSQEVNFHVLTESHADRKFLHDLITNQWWSRLNGFDKNTMLFPLDADGSPVPSSVMYPDLIKPVEEGGYGWRQIRCMNMQSYAPPSRVTAPLYTATVRGLFEVDLP